MIPIDDDLKHVVEEKGFLDDRLKRTGTLTYTILEMLAYSLYVTHTSNSGCSPASLEVMIDSVRKHLSGDMDTPYRPGMKILEDE